MLYQFLTGRLPYEGSSLAELAIRQQNEKPLPPETYNSDVPATVSAAVMRALDADPAVRYVSAAEMSDGLERGLRGEDVTVALTRADDDLAGYSRAEAATRPLERTSRTAQRPPPPPQSVPIPPRPTVKQRSLPARAARFLGCLLSLVLIAALVAGSFAATRELARLVGEAEFSSMSHQGARDSIQIALLGERALFAAVYDQRSNLGLVRWHAKESCCRMASMLKRREDAPPPALPGDYAKDAAAALDQLL